MDSRLSSFSRVSVLPADLSRQMYSSQRPQTAHDAYHHSRHGFPGPATWPKSPLQYRQATIRFSGRQQTRDLNHEPFSTTHGTSPWVLLPARSGGSRTPLHAANAARTLFRRNTTSTKIGKTTQITAFPEAVATKTVCIIAAIWAGPGPPGMPGAAVVTGPLP